MPEDYTSVLFHNMLIADEARSNAYQKAISQAVNPGDVVIDIGAGSGLLSLFAVKAGAAKVYAIERTAIIKLAKQLAIENGCADKIVFIHDDAMQVELPEKADVIVSELISKAVIGQQFEGLVSHFKAKHLKPNGRIIPAQVDLMIAPVDCPEIYQKIEFPDYSVYGLSFHCAREYTQNSLVSGRISDHNLLSDSKVFYSVDSYQVTENQYPVCNKTFCMKKKGVLHGFVAWFEMTLTDAIRLSCSPPGIKSWDNLFFLVPEPCDVDISTRIDLELLGREFNGQAIWSWKTTIKSTSDATNEIRFSQTNFSSMIMNLSEFKNQKNNPVFYDD